MDGRSNRPNHRPQHINMDQADPQRPTASVVPNMNLNQQMQITDRGFQAQPVANNPGNPNHFGQGNLIGPGQLGNFQPPVNMPNGGHPANTDIPARHDPIGPLSNMNNGPNPDHMRAPNTLTPPGNPRQPPPGAPGSTGGFNGFY